MPDREPIHTLTVHFDAGEYDYLTLECHATGPERPCAIIVCPFDHEDVDRECIKEHGATALDKCWAVEWYEAGGRDSLNTESLESISFPVNVYFDEGIVADNLPSDGGDHDGR